jgi:hypothetical protein
LTASEDAAVVDDPLEVESSSCTIPAAVVEAAVTEITGVVVGSVTTTGAVPDTDVTVPTPPPPVIRIDPLG